MTKGKVLRYTKSSTDQQGDSYFDLMLFAFDKYIKKTIFHSQFWVSQLLKPNYFKKQHHHFYLLKAIIQVLKGNGVINRLVSCLKS